VEQMRRDVIRNILKIVECLNNAKDWMWIRQIARKTNLHHKTVSRLIDTYLSIFIEEQSLEPFKIRMIRLKEGVSLDSIHRFFVLKEKLESK
jgi:predicted DNA-binding transcriptional regulator YafY